MTYREMISQTAKLLGKRARFFNFLIIGLDSKHWVSIFGSVPPTLAGP